MTDTKTNELPRDAMDDLARVFPTQHERIEKILDLLQDLTPPEQASVLSDVTARSLIGGCKPNIKVLTSRLSTYDTALTVTILAILPLIYKRWKAEGVVKDDSESNPPKHRGSGRSGSYFAGPAHSWRGTEPASNTAQASAPSRVSEPDKDPDSN